MLVLTRKLDERVFIGDDIVITVVSIRGDHTVQIGISAPKHVAIEREEVRNDRISMESIYDNNR